MERLQISHNKILEGNALKRTLARWRFQNEKIVFSNGCFDIIHPGHIEYLSKARDFGSKLIIGLNTDNSVSRLKGASRPIISQQQRAMMLASLHFVDAVVLFDEDTPYNLISQVQPDILVKGADYKPEDIVGFDIVTAKGGVVETIELVEGFSTTEMIQKIKQQ
jgi:rfaE bifunctional protein nucleotidyltransferase chain/domain